MGIATTNSFPGYCTNRLLHLVSRPHDEGQAALQDIRKRRPTFLAPVSVEHRFEVSVDVPGLLHERFGNVRIEA